MIPWHNRPREIAYLLNPAFCAEIMRRCIYRYQQTSKSAFPYALLSLILPIILHSETRQYINTQRYSMLHVWLENNQEVKIGFAERVSALLPFTNEAIIFLLQVGAVTLTHEAEVTVTKYRPINFEASDNEEIRSCFYGAETIGRWFARAGAPAMIYIMWGVKP